MNIATRDFPDWLGPMLVKELRQGLKARAFVLSFVALQAILVFTVVMYTLNYAEDPAEFTPTGFTSFFWLLIGLQLLIVTPLRAIHALAAERTSRTLELIFMTGLSSWRIAFGKWASLLFQALLFVLAVLPYAILRYFFGGVNLSEELIILGFLIVLSATFTAVTLAISGMPGFVRGVAVALAVFFLMSVMPGLLFGFFLGGRAVWGAGIAFSVGWEPVMGLLFFNAALICLAGLEVAGATIAPLAENHALRQRLLVLAAWLPVPLLLAFKVNEAAIAQLCFFGGLAVLSCWYDLARQPRVMRNQVEPFARRGAAASFIGRIFYPGWPGALLFFIVCAALCGSTGVVVWKQTVSSPPWIHAAAMFFMSGAALLTPPLLIGHRFRARLPLVEQSLVHVAGGIVALFGARLAAIYDSEIGAHPLIGLFPPSGLWAIPSAPEANLFAWLTIALIAFTIITAVLIGRAVPYWTELRVVERDIRRAREAKPRATAALIP